MPKNLKLNFGDIAVKNAGRAGGVAANHLLVDNLLLPMLGIQDDLMIGVGKIFIGAIVEESFKKEPFVANMGVGVSVMGTSQLLRGNGVGIPTGATYPTYSASAVNGRPTGMGYMPTGVKGHVIGNVQHPTGIKNHVMAGNPAS